MFSLDINSRLVGIIETKIPEMAYPVGSHMYKNFDRIHALSIAVKKFIDKDVNVNIWCRGSSGCIIAALISEHIRSKASMVQICYVAKDGESNHGSDTSSFSALVGGVDIIVDDFICTGSTMEQILGRVNSVDLIAVTGNGYEYQLKKWSDKGFTVKNMICSEFNINPKNKAL